MTGTSMLQTGLALVLVIGLVLALGWLVQRLGGPRRGRDLTVLSQTSLGQRERVVVVAWDGQEWMLGVGPGRVNLLAHRDSATLPPVGAQPLGDSSGSTGIASRNDSPRGLGSCQDIDAAAASPVGAQPPGRFEAVNEPLSRHPSFGQAFAQQLQQTLSRWSQR